MFSKLAMPLKSSSSQNNIGFHRRRHPLSIVARPMTFRGAKKEEDDEVIVEEEEKDKKEADDVFEEVLEAVKIHIPTERRNNYQSKKAWRAYTHFAMNKVFHGCCDIENEEDNSIFWFQITSGNIVEIFVGGKCFSVHFDH